jgi:alpha-glucoside transport system substrate-binding protein
MEDLMLRFADGETYDAWVAHDIPFNDPAVLKTIEEAAKIIKNADYVGDVPSIATTMFDAAPAGLVTGECAMHRQASFASGWLGAEGPLGGELVGPEQTDVEGGVSVFYFPGVSADQRPALAAGEFIGAFSDAPAVQAVQMYLASADWNNARASLGGWISTHNELDTANIDALILRESVNILQSATLLKFDASDLMPGNVGSSPGAGTFWGEMTNWVANDKSNEDVLDSIEAFWSASE